MNPRELSSLEEDRLFACASEEEVRDTVNAILAARDDATQEALARARTSDAQLNVLSSLLVNMVGTLKQMREVGAITLGDTWPQAQALLDWCDQRDPARPDPGCVAGFHASLCQGCALDDCYYAQA